MKLKFIKTNGYVVDDGDISFLISYFSDSFEYISEDENGAVFLSPISEMPQFTAEIDSGHLIIDCDDGERYTIIIILSKLGYLYTGD